MSGFIVDDADEFIGNDMDDDGAEINGDVDADPFDTVCAICDNGGDIIWYGHPLYTQVTYVFIHKLWLGLAPYF